MNRLHSDIQLQGCQQGHMLPEHPKTMWPVAEDIVRSPDVSGPHTMLGQHHEERHGCPLARREDALDPWWPTAGPRGPQYVRADNAYVSGCCLGLCRGPQRQQTSCCRVRPGERSTPRRSGGCALGSRGQRIGGVARRAIVFVSVSSGRRAGRSTRPWPRITVQRAPGCSVGLSASSTCPSLQRSAPTWTISTPFEANGTGSSLLTRCSSTTICVTRQCPGSTKMPQPPAA